MKQSSDAMTKSLWHTTWLVGAFFALLVIGSSIVSVGADRAFAQTDPELSRKIKILARRAGRWITILELSQTILVCKLRVMAPHLVLIRARASIFMSRLLLHKPSPSTSTEWAGMVGLVGALCCPADPCKVQPSLPVRRIQPPGSLSVIGQLPTPWL